jgi:pimeloyl-ACP methyl ester carboxylesterase
MPSFTAPDGVEIAYDDVGPREGRAALLIHGFASNRNEAWKRTGWYAAFERRGQRVVAMDLRGHGESGKPHDPAAYDPETLVGDVVGLMDHLGLGQVDLFGYSMGSRLALAVAKAHPERVAHLIVGGLGERALQPSGSGDVMAQAMEAENPESIPVPILKSFRQFADEQGEDRLALAAMVRGKSAPLTADDLSALTMPVLVAAGTQDVLAGDPRELADHIAGAHAVTLPGCDHFNAIPHALLKAAVFDFLDGYLDLPSP